MGARWADEPPRAPLTKQEVKQLHKKPQETDEYTVLRTLADLGSTAARIITWLQLSRAMVKEALGSLLGNRAAQVALVAILGATRFRVHHRNRGQPTRCGKCRHVEDSVDHLLRCYDLLTDHQGGENAADFLVKIG